MNKTIYKILRRPKLEKIFTPSDNASITYVHRKNLESDFFRYLIVPGMQIVLYGYTQSGKTTLIRKILKEQKLRHIETGCEGHTTVNDLIIQAFDFLGAYYKSESKFSKTYGIKSSIKAKYREIESSIEASSSYTDESKVQRIVPIQLTAQRLASFLGEAKCIWVIDDFHKVAEQEKKKISDLLKIFVDSANKYPNTKVICIGAVGTAHELVKLEDNLSNRVTEIPVPLLTNEEIYKVVDTGFNLLKVTTNNSHDLKDKICHYSNSLATVCHQLCFNICFNKKLFYAPFRSHTEITDHDFRRSIDSFVKEHSATLETRYDKACSIALGEELLKTILLINAENVRIEILKEKSRKLKSLSKGGLEELIMKLTSSEYGEILRFDQNNPRIYFTSPFFKAYVKMKVEAEKADDAFKQKNINMSLKESAFLTDKFYDQYYGLLDDIVIRRQKIIRKEIELITKKLEKSSTEDKKEKDE